VQIQTSIIPAHSTGKQPHATPTHPKTKADNLSATFEKQVEPPRRKDAKNPFNPLASLRLGGSNPIQKILCLPPATSSLDCARE
jgi:hypothetical protein